LARGIFRGALEFENLFCSTFVDDLPFSEEWPGWGAAVRNWGRRKSGKGPGGVLPLETSGDEHVFLYAFDLLEHDGMDYRGEPLENRKRKLAKLLATADPGVRFNEHIELELPIGHKPINAREIVRRRTDHPGAG
jgi:hypothetical protein